MADLKSRLLYFSDSLRKRVKGAGNRCPGCGAADGIILDRKALVTDFRRCPACELLYRTPTDDMGENERFYQSDYQEGFTTTVPSDSELEQMKKSRFADTARSYQPYIDVLRALNLPGTPRLFDYGCSWGYGSWQFAQDGFDVTAYEISQPRAAYARDKLGARVITGAPESVDWASLAGSFDIFFSAHVIEHVPNAIDLIRLGTSLVRPGGYVVIFTPNAGDEYRTADAASWHLLWGKVHPQLITPRFFKKWMPPRHWLDTTPIDVDAVGRFAQGHNPEPKALSRIELMCIAQVPA